MRYFLLCSGRLHSDTCSGELQTPRSATTKAGRDTPHADLRGVHAFKAYEKIACLFRMHLISYYGTC